MCWLRLHRTATDGAKRFRFPLALPSISIRLYGLYANNGGDPRSGVLSSNSNRRRKTMSGLDDAGFTGSFGRQTGYSSVAPTATLLGGQYGVIRSALIKPAVPPAIKGSQDSAGTRRLRPE